MPQAHSKAASDESDVVEIPPELVCRLCEGLIRDAVIIPCCGENYCDECECAVTVFGVCGCAWMCHSLCSSHTFLATHSSACVT